MLISRPDVQKENATETEFILPWNWVRYYQIVIILWNIHYHTYNHCSRPEGASICCHCRRSVTCVLVNDIQYISALMLEIFVLKNDDICLVIGSEVLQLSKKTKTSALFQIIWHVVGTRLEAVGFDVETCSSWLQHVVTLSICEVECVETLKAVHLLRVEMPSIFCYWGIYITHNYQCCLNNK